MTRNLALLLLLLSPCVLSSPARGSSSSSTKRDDKLDKPKDKATKDKLETSSSYGVGLYSAIPALSAYSSGSGNAGGSGSSYYKTQSEGYAYGGYGHGHEYGHGHGHLALPQVLPALKYHHHQPHPFLPAPPVYTSVYDLIPPGLAPYIAAYLKGILPPLPPMPHPHSGYHPLLDLPHHHVH